MATCDPDGRIMQSLRDRMACLSMEIHESLLDSLGTVGVALMEVELSALRGKGEQDQA
jgi:hypothetical protein